MPSAPRRFRRWVFFLGTHSSPVPLSQHPLRESRQFCHGESGVVQRSRLSSQGYDCAFDSLPVPTIYANWCSHWPLQEDFSCLALPAWWVAQMLDLPPGILVNFPCQSISRHCGISQQSDEFEICSFLMWIFFSEQKICAKKNDGSGFIINDVLGMWGSCTFFHSWHLSYFCELKSTLGCSFPPSCRLSGELSWRINLEIKIRGLRAVCNTVSKFSFRSESLKPSWELLKVCKWHSAAFNFHRKKQNKIWSQVQRKSWLLLVINSCVYSRHITQQLAGSSFILHGAYFYNWH